jgi:hypothetical protein
MVLGFACHASVASMNEHSVKAMKNNHIGGQPHRSIYDAVDDGHRIAFGSGARYYRHYFAHGSDMNSVIFKEFKIG